MKPSIGRIVHAFDRRGANAAIVTRVHADGETCDLFVFQCDAKGAGFVQRVPWAGPEAEQQHGRLGPRWGWPPKVAETRLVLG